MKLIILYTNEYTIFVNAIFSVALKKYSSLLKQSKNFSYLTFLKIESKHLKLSHNFLGVSVCDKSYFLGLYPQ